MSPGLRRGLGWTTAATVLLFALLIGLPAGVEAQEPDEDPEQEVVIDSPFRWIERGFRAALGAGYLRADRGGDRLGPGSTEIVTGLVRGRVSTPLSLEAKVTYGRSDRLVIDPRLETGPAPVDTVSSDWLMVEGGLQFAFTGDRTWNRLHPYAALGVGLQFGLNEETSEVFADPELARFRADIGTSLVVQAGVGTEVKVSDRLGISFEFRDHLWRVSTPDGFFEPEILERIEELGLRAPEESVFTHNLEFSVTFWRYF